MRSVASENPVPTCPQYTRPRSPCTPTSSEPISPVLLPLPGFQPATTTSWRSRFLTFSQLPVLAPGSYLESSRFATTPSSPFADGGG